MQQTTFASDAWEKKGKITRRERFLAEMDAVQSYRWMLTPRDPYITASQSFSALISAEPAAQRRHPPRGSDHSPQMTGRSRGPP
jgi:hypothetical protein